MARPTVAHQRHKDKRRRQARKRSAQTANATADEDLHQSSSSASLSDTPAMSMAQAGLAAGRESAAVAGHAVKAAMQKGIDTMYDGIESMKHLHRTARAALSSDLSRLPDVQGLIRGHVEHLEQLQHAVAEKIFATSRALVEHVWHLPEAQDVILTNLAGIPEVQEKIEPLMDKGMDKREAVREALETMDDLEVPEPIRAELAQLPTVRQRMASMLQNMEQFSADVIDVIRDNVAHLKDVQALVASNVDKLPHLQELIDRYFAPARPALRHFDHCPSWMQDNHYIVQGYRPEMLSLQRCLWSLTYLHNESGNIYTHLLGGIFFVVCAIYGACYWHHDHNWQDQALLYTFWTSAVICLLCSTTFHLCYCHSASMHRWFAMLDYIGIVALISGSVATCEYFAWYCHPRLALAYMGLTLFFGALTTWSLFSDRFSGPSSRAIRVFLFIALAATGFIPSLHFWALYGSEHFNRVIDMFWLMGLSCPLYLIGSAIYILKIPERFAPGYFDMFFHSHQLWHLFVISGAITHYMCVANMMQYRKNCGCGFEDMAFDAWEQEDWDSATDYPCS